jgi:hypothetical protein
MTDDRRQSRARHWRAQALTALAFLSSFAAAPSFCPLFCRGAAGEDRVPVPVELAQKEAEKKVRDLFKQEYAGQKDAEKLKLAKKLLETGKATEGDPVSRFVLLREARDVAVSLHDLALAFEAIDAIAARYLVDALQMKGDAASAVAQKTKDDAVRRRAAVECLYLADDALAGSNPEAAARFLGTAETAERKAGSDWLDVEVERRRDTLRLVKEWVRPVSEAVERLVVEPEDAGANLVLGKYLCLVLGKWEQGVPKLLAASDAKLRELAERELRSPAEPEGQVGLGDAWWELAEAEVGPLKEALQLRAYHWHLAARSGLTGLAQREIETKLNRAPRRYLSEMEEFDAVVGHGKFGKMGKLGWDDDREIQVDALKSPFGLFMHAPTRGFSSVKYRLGRQFKKLEAVAALDERSDRTRPLQFVVLGDGDVLWKSQSIPAQKRSQRLSVSISQVDVLELRVYCPGRFDGAHAVWLDPLVRR